MVKESRFCDIRDESVWCSWLRWLHRRHTLNHTVATRFYCYFAKIWPNEPMHNFLLPWEPFLGRDQRWQGWMWRRRSFIKMIIAYFTYIVQPSNTAKRIFCCGHVITKAFFSWLVRWSICLLQSRILSFFCFCSPLKAASQKTRKMN